MQNISPWDINTPFVDDQGRLSRQAVMYLNGLFGNANPDSSSGVPDAPTIAVAKSGVNSVLIGVEKPSVTAAGWNDVRKIEIEVAYFSEPAWAVTQYAKSITGSKMTTAQFTFVSASPGRYKARARATNGIGTGAWATLASFDTDAAAGDTDVPSAPTLTLYNSADEATVPAGKIRAKIDFSTCTNALGIWMGAVQFHTSGTMTNPEASPVYNPGTSKGTISQGGNTLVDASEGFAGVSAGDVVMCTYEAAWPASPATRVFLAGIKSVTSGQLTIYGNWSQPSGDYLYRVVKNLEDPSIGSGVGFLPWVLIYDGVTRNKGYVEIDIAVTAGTNYYARAWVTNLLGRSAASSTSAAKQSSTVGPGNASKIPELTAGTFTNNSPGAGYVAWSGCKVAYNGVENTISNSNTNNTWIIWDSAFPTQFTGLASVPSLTTGQVIIGINGAGTFVSQWAPGQIIQAKSIYCVDLSAINVNAGLITAGTFRGTTFETLASGSANRVAMDSTGFHVFDGTATEWITIQPGTYGAMILTPGIKMHPNIAGTLTVSGRSNVGNNINIFTGDGTVLGSRSGVSLEHGGSVYIYTSNTDRVTISSTGLNLASGLVYQINGATVLSSTVYGVTGGDGHNHDGGDGAQIAYSSLSGLPTIPSVTGSFMGTNQTNTMGASGIIDFYANSGKLKLRYGTSAGWPTTSDLADGEICVWYNNPTGTRLYIRNGSNMFYTALFT